MTRHHRISDVAEMTVLARGPQASSCRFRLPDDHRAGALEDVDGDGVPHRDTLTVDHRLVRGAQPGGVEEVLDEHRDAGKRPVQPARRASAWSAHAGITALSGAGSSNPRR
jgi:hypothetical protein